MPSVAVQAYASGFDGKLFNDQIHKKAELMGLTVDNRGIQDQVVKLYDGFLTTSGKTVSGGSAVVMEDLGVTDVLSGIKRFQHTVPAGQTVNLGEPDLAEVEFLGQATALCSADSSDCIVIARYRLK